MPGDRDGSDARTRLPGVGRVLVVIPTYNEADNVGVIVDRVRRAAPAVEVLIADDNSPDGTGAIADELAAGDAHVHVLHRPGKQGLGAAYVAGFGWAREHGYDAVVEMDADGSHAPEELPRLLDAARRRRRGDRLPVDRRRRRWSTGRGTGSCCPAAATCTRGWRWACRCPDATGGYRVYRMPALDEIDLELGRLAGLLVPGGAVAGGRTGPGCRIVEVPITFAERERGASKMSPVIIGEALWRVTAVGALDRRGGRRACTAPPPARHGDRDGSRWP